MPSSPPTTSTPPPDILQPPDQISTTHAPPRPQSSTSPRTLRIGTRASALAIAQVDIFASLIKTLHPTLVTETVPISVAGDRDKTTNLHTLAQGGKSLWTEELEVLLLKGDIDCIVHSLKDVPTKVVEGCEVKVAGDRGERRDCVVFPKRHAKEDDASAATTASLKEAGNGTLAAAEEEGGTSVNVPSNYESHPNKKRKISSSTAATPKPRTLSSLPPDSVVGTSSVRRSAMILRRYPHLRILTARGNIGTRLRKLDDPANGFDCIILAGTGIQRIGLGDRIDEWLDPGPVSREDDTTDVDGGEDQGKKAMMLYAVGQGAIGLEIRRGDEWMSSLLEGKEGQRGVVVNRVSWECQAERSLLRTLEGGCSVPVGVSCFWEEEKKEKEKVEDRDYEEASPSGAGKENKESLSASATPPSDLAMAPGTLRMVASVTSVDGTECVAASRRQWISNDKEANDAGWELAKVLVDRGAGRILEGIGLNRGMVERGDGA
ncbi:MAG: hypothetical protein Q9216_000254 [Gyalolechia sp. 2 TL-2023]